MSDDVEASLFSLTPLLERFGLTPAKTLVMRHRPTEPEIRRLLPSLVTSEPDLFRIYQSIQWPRAESALARADHLLAFIGQKSGQATFAGAFRIKSFKDISQAEYWNIPENQKLKQLGMSGSDDREHRLLFDLEPLPGVERWVGKLIVKWPGLERSWYRWADRNYFEIASLLQDSVFDEPKPDWKTLSLTWAQLAILPTLSRAELSRWRGIYYIYDVSKRLGYVGSACGEENIFGRWRNYSATGHGGNKGLKGSDPLNLRFSVLQVVAHDLPRDEVNALEGLWKTRLHTRAPHGLNEN